MNVRRNAYMIFAAIVAIAITLSSLYPCLQQTPIVASTSRASLEGKLRSLLYLRNVILSLQQDHS